MIMKEHNRRCCLSTKQILHSLVSDPSFLNIFPHPYSDQITAFTAGVELCQENLSVDETFEVMSSY